MSTLTRRHNTSTVSCDGCLAKLTSGEYKTILQLVTVLRHGKEGKHLTDRAINAMDGVQNLRKAVYE